MKFFMIRVAMLLAFFLQSAHAGEMKVIELSDGSVVTGEVLSLSNGVYTIQSGDLVTIKLDESKIKAIRSKGPAGSDASKQGNAGGSEDQMSALKSRIQSDPEIMNRILSLKDDPKFKAVLEDPEIMAAVNAGNVAALSSNPKFMRLLDDPRVQDIGRKVK